MLDGIRMLSVAPSVTWIVKLFLVSHWDGRSWWGRLWSLKLPSKVKLFLWRAFHGILSCYDSPGSRGIKCLRGCSSLKNTKAVSFDGLCMDIGGNGTRDELEVFTAIAWALWQSRNAWVHSKRLRDARDTLDLAGRALGDFHLLIRDHLGVVVAACARHIEGSFIPYIVECLALRGASLSQKSEVPDGSYGDR
ncbi:hypothetical protein TIFTF001_024771 [Ficus carica]|uniref:Reverse transcriptase zinc-binding domain-containing protein n=1 Tax=Ficus carica TaxID=3494 RepID=A0AA88AHH1_FICCA|nr:hypothetical protein TIFTF001_024771 [Ficus carica]